MFTFEIIILFNDEIDTNFNEMVTFTIFCWYFHQSTNNLNDGLDDDLK